MQYNGILIDFDFLPMVDAVPSILNLHVEIKHLQILITIAQYGSIENLAAKFGFQITGEHSWDFTGFKGRECILSKDDKGFHFVKFV